MTIPNVTTNNFVDEVEKQALPVLLDFWAPWCGQCTMLTKVIERVAEKVKGKAIVCKVNADDSQAGELVRKFSITKLPTLVLTERGNEISRVSGMLSETALTNLILNSHEKNSK